MRISAGEVLPEFRIADREQTRKPEHGFTMIEILIVMVILGLMAALVGPNVIKSGTTARTKITRTQIASLANSLHALALDCGRYPTTQEGLVALIERPSDMKGWDGPYVEADSIPVDAWQNEFVYRGPDGDGRFEILSHGSDGVPGGDDQAADISSRQANAASRKN